MNESCPTRFYQPMQQQQQLQQQQHAKSQRKRRNIPRLFRAPVCRSWHWWPQEKPQPFALQETITETPIPAHTAQTTHLMDAGCTRHTPLHPIKKRALPSHRPAHVNIISKLPFTGLICSPTVTWLCMTTLAIGSGPLTQAR